MSSYGSTRSAPAERLRPPEPGLREAAAERDEAESAAPLVVSLRNVRREFAGRVVLDDVNLDVRAGEFVALLGASGSGKTTILRAIAGLDTRFVGELTSATQQAVVFQEHRLLPWLRVWQNVVVGLPQANAKQRARAALAEVGLTARSQAWPGTLSGGESQRAALARALVRQPSLLLLDEPFASLDALTRLRMQQFVARLCAEHGYGVLLVTHDVDEALLLADRALVLADGRIGFELRIDVPRPRPAEYAGRSELRMRLLGELGVDASVAIDQE
jgi:sulfonate transport system ATP-binding protein